MLNKLIFFNHFGAGDIFESREFVKDIMSIIPANEYIYAHGKNKRMLADIPNLKYMEVTHVMVPGKATLLSNNDLYLNTWIGQDSKYVLSQVGCVIDKNFEMFNNNLKKAGYRELSNKVMDYLPSVDFSYFNTKPVDDFVESLNGKKVVLICNGMVNSSQSFNFSFEEPIYNVANNNKDVMFIVTQDLPVKLDNVISTNEVIKSDDGFDLNEISYLAKFADTIIGRKSGPFVFSHNKDVWYSNKKSLSFTFAEHSSHFVQGNDLPLRKFWSPATEQSEIIKRIEEVINV